MLTTPQPVGNSPADLDTWEYVIELRKVDKLDKTVVSEHPVSKVV